MDVSLSNAVLFVHISAAIVGLMLAAVLHAQLFALRRATKVEQVRLVPHTIAGDVFVVHAGTFGGLPAWGSTYPPVCLACPVCSAPHRLPGRRIDRISTARLPLAGRQGRSRLVRCRLRSLASCCGQGRGSRRLTESEPRLRSAGCIRSSSTSLRQAKPCTPSPRVTASRCAMTAVPARTRVKYGQGGRVRRARGRALTPRASVAYLRYRLKTTFSTS